MSPFFARVHSSLRRGLAVMAVASALIPAAALAAAPEAPEAAAEARTVPTAQPVALAPDPGQAAVEARGGHDGDADVRASTAGTASDRAVPPRTERQPERASRSRSAAPADGSAGEADAGTADVEPQEGADDPGAAVFATAAGQELVLPDAVRGIGFHEANSPHAVPLEPVGTATSNLNATRVSLPPDAGPSEYLVLPSRGRAGAATSAVDISVDHGVPVTSPVTGVVEQADSYRLYGRTADEMVEIVPDGRPDLRVRVLHVEGLAVAVGDRVEAGVTVLAATGRQLPFPSQIDRHVGARPHIHLEVHPRPPEGEGEGDAPPLEG